MNIAEQITEFNETWKGLLTTLEPGVVVVTTPKGEIVGKFEPHGWDEVTFEPSPLMGGRKTGPLPSLRDAFLWWLDEHPVPDMRLPNEF